MRGPQSIGKPSRKQQQLIDELEQMVIEHFANEHMRGKPFVLDPHAVGVAELVEIQDMFVEQANKAGWNAAIENGVLVVRKP